MSIAGRVLRIALTGGIASGKSTVAELFARQGIPIIDADVIARQVVEPGQPALLQVVTELGEEVLGPDGRLDRRRLRERIFADPSVRRRLEAILHPAIRTAMDRQSASAGGPYQMLVIPLLTEGGGRGDRADRVLVVDVPESVQVERLMQRDRVGREQALAALQAQASRTQRLAIADDVIFNADGPAELEPQVLALHAKYLGLTPRSADIPQAG